MTTNKQTRDTKATRNARLTEQLRTLGLTFEEIENLRRIERTLHRWAEMECGDGNDRASWSIERGEEKDLRLINWPDASGNVWLVEHREGKGFTPLQEFKTTNLNDKAATRALRLEKSLNVPGKPYRCVYPHQGKPYKMPVADREAGALKRLQAIIDAQRQREGFPALSYYHQGDPRGCALYLLRPQDHIAGQSVDSYYTRGIAVAFE